MPSNNVLSAQNSAELLSYIINVTPVLSENIDLPVQGESIKPIGQIIINNERYKNAFINTVNLIGLTVIKRNGWDNPWDFTVRGTLNYGQQVREIVLDLVQAYDYNQNVNDEDAFLNTVVPNVFNYIHEINFQKYYETTTSDSQVAMAFEREDLFTLIDETIAMLTESFKYDRYIIDKYQLCRRILDGTTTSIQLQNYNSMTPRERVSAMKSISNKMTFRSPNYNPAGVNRATSFADQILIVNTQFEADFSTQVLATSYFKDEADMRSRMVLIDGFNNHDTARLSSTLGDAYVPFTDSELTALGTIPAVLISREFFMDYYYTLDNGQEMKMTEFYNPSTLRKNTFLHAWMVFSTSPFENCAVFTSDSPSISSVSVTPSTASVTKGQQVQLGATVVANGFANKSVSWSVAQSNTSNVATINQNGVLTIPSSYNTTGSGTAGVYTIDIDTVLETGDKVSVNGVDYTVNASSQDTIAKQITAMKSALNNAKVTDYFTIGGTSTTTTLTEKSGGYGSTPAPVFAFTPASGSDGECAIETTTAGALPANTVIAIATSVYDNTKHGTSKITVS